jgi:2-polyprenyl-3-methyl-5-hydroxy-6-metoxy-1,4-benzoquinol methylase
MNDRENEVGNRCRLCGSADLGLLIDLGNQPIAHRLLERVEDEFIHPLKVHYCKVCGLGQICDPIDPEILYRQYNYCFSSWKPEPHRETELEVIGKHKRKASVFEIGCNDGLFMQQLKDHGQRVCVGLEPNSFARQIASQRGFQVYETFLDEATCRTALSAYGRFDLVVARQVLEHVSDLRLFFQCAHSLLADDGLIFIDVPNVGPGMERGDCTIVWEEHVNYFTEEVLQRTLDHFGYFPLWLNKFNFSGGALAVLARRKTAADQGELNGNSLAVAAQFREQVGRYGEKLRSALAKTTSVYDRVVLYGVGCRACTLVNGLQLGKAVHFAIDDQLERQGKLMPGSHLPIKSPAAVAQARRALVLLAVNQENETKVKSNLEKLCPTTRLSFLSVLGPNNIQLELDALLQTLA